MTASEIVQLLDRVFDHLDEPVSQCIKISDERILFLMDTGPANATGVIVLNQVTHSQKDQVFTVRNPHGKEFAVWSVDGCTKLETLRTALMDNRCEAIVFNNREIAFVEFKVDATSDSALAMKSNQKKGAMQLEKTIVLVRDAFKSANVRTPWVERKAILVTHPGFAREQPSINIPAWQERLWQLGGNPKRKSNYERLQTKFMEMGFQYLEVNAMVLN